ncbi:hypothetical protein HMSSN036_19830 [Paenibacillus macerans]|nr:hypothetical protein HMSSN036_19830 [Paenibacillus macerans]
MRQNIQVPFGYEPPAPSRKGTVIFYDSFMRIADEDLEFAAAEARRAFAKLVLYPLHELTVKRMSNEQAGPFYQREDRLHAWKREGRRGCGGAGGRLGRGSGRNIRRRIPRFGI